MKQKSHAKQEGSHQQQQQREKQMSDIADKALKGYEQAMRTGVKLQEEATHWWTNILNQAASPHDWQQRVNNVGAIANGIMPAAQRRMEEILQLMEKNSRTGADLVKKAVDAAQTPVIAESQAKWMDFWTASMSAARSNAEAFTEINSKAIDSWINYVRKNTEVTEIRVPKSA
jgi:hypothetical protein